MSLTRKRLFPPTLARPSFTEHGFELVSNFLSDYQLSEFQTDLQLPDGKTSAGIRHAEQHFRSVREYVNSADILSQARHYLPRSPRFIRAIVFNKTAHNNWLVAPHQDKTITVAKKFSHPSWGPWSAKDGVLHVQPPLEVLESMVTFRIHIDDSTEETGCVSLVPGSHKLGIINAADIVRISKDQTKVSCPGAAGSALVMRPHILHASAKGTAPSSRRVLHIEYGCYELPTD